MKNLKRNSLLTAAMVSSLLPVGVQLLVPLNAISKDEAIEIIVSPTIDPETGRSFIFYKKDRETLGEMGAAVEEVVEAKVDRMQRSSLALSYLSFLLTLFLVFFALLSHEKSNPYKT